MTPSPEPDTSAAAAADTAASYTSQDNKVTGAGLYTHDVTTALGRGCA